LRVEPFFTTKPRGKTDRKSMPWIAAGSALQKGMGAKASALKCCRAGAIVLTLFAAFICGAAIAGR